SDGWLSMMLSGLATEPWLTEMVKLGSADELVPATTQVTTPMITARTAAAAASSCRRRLRLYRGRAGEAANLGEDLVADKDHPRTARLGHQAVEEHLGPRHGGQEVDAQHAHQDH